nr:glutamic acid-rich protein-like [Nicotiana tomentosiformis]
MRAEAQVMLKLINTQLIPCNHDTLISRERTCVLYFLMTGQRVNVAHLIRYQMTRVRTSKRIDQMPFANMLTQYLRQEEVYEEKAFDHIIDQPLRLMDITSVRVKEDTVMPSIPGAERNARDDSFMAHLYGMMDLQRQIGGRSATTEESAILEEQDENVNTHEKSEAEPEQSDKDDDEDEEEEKEEEEAKDEEWAAFEDEGDDEA